MNHAALLALTGIMMAFALAGCDGGQDDGPLDVAVIGSSETLFAEVDPLPTGARHVRGATTAGLVALDAQGQIVPAIAERWIVTDDAMSYIFRLRDSAWPDGEAITADEVEASLKDTFRSLEGTALGLDLSKIVEIRAMTGRVVEIQLSSPMPEFLRLLAQPELGITRRVDGMSAGPMVAETQGGGASIRLDMPPAPENGARVRPFDTARNARPITVRAYSSRDAIDSFANGQVDVVFGGRYENLAMVELGPLSRGAIRVDPAIGLFGLVVGRETDFLSQPELREALSMAIDREALIEPFGLDGWQPTTWIVPQTLFTPLQYPDTRWSDLTIEQRRARARARVADWQSRSGTQPRVSIHLPPDPGSDVLFDQIASAWDAIGVEAVLAETREESEMWLMDEVARYSSPRWFLNRFACSVTMGPCSPTADALIAESLGQQNPSDKQSLLADAHIELIEQEVFIPFGAPIRWSLVRGAVEGYEANPWSLHPLFPLSQRPN